MSGEVLPVLMLDDEAVDPHDFDALFVRHFPGLVRAITAISGDRETAADCVQEAFVRAHKRWDKLVDYDDPVGWVRHVALNLARDSRRRRKRGVALHLRLVVEHEAVAPPAEPGADLGALFAGLPRRQREALALFYIEGLSVLEVAAALGISEGAVKFHLHQGRERLRPLVENRER